MSRVKSSSDRPRTAPASTIEARENQMVSLAVDLAEKQLREGTASAQVIVHYLKLGTTRERLEKEKLSQEVKLASAKTQNLESQQRDDHFYEKVLEAMKVYSGNAED